MPSSPTLSLSGATRRVGRDEQRELLRRMVDSWGPVRSVLIVPPDFTRFHSGAGEITEDLWRLLEGRATVKAMPALGTHNAMPPEKLAAMFGEVPSDAFIVHDWRGGVVQLGEVPGAFVREVSGGRVDYPITAEIGRPLAEGGFDRIVSVGQVVPHEVIGMANHNKNLFVGTGGQDTINKTHFLGAVSGMESLMGKERSPVRDVLNWAEREFLGGWPISYVLTVRSRDETGGLVTRGLWVGEGDEGFLEACRLSQEVNIELREEPFRRVVVWLDPEEFGSTWLGNKAIYRTRMALADEADLIILAPGLHEFGEDAEIDRLIRRYGYRTTPEILAAVEANEELRRNLSAAAHLIHGSSEGRFRVTYAAGELGRQEIESVGYRHASCDELIERYRPDERRDGPQRLATGEEFFWVSNPALGLWATRARFSEGSDR